jgi:2'-5' RNA ligase
VLLQAVIVPPPWVLAAVALAVRSVDGVAAVAAPAPPAKGGFLRRRASPVAPAPQVAEAGDEELELIPAERMSIPVAGFGNVARDDAVRLDATLRAAAAEWKAPTVWLAGGGALEFPDDRSVWAKLDGDIEALLAVANGVAESAMRRGFFLDRRAFRPWLALATITDSTTASHLENVVAALDEFRSEPWTIEWISLTKPFFEDSVSVQKELYRIPLAPA